MNIFVLDTDPVLAAQYQCDRHVIKMVLESTQLLSNAFSLDDAPYKRTHYNHPCSIWTRESYENWQWLMMHAVALADEYTYRYNKSHKCLDVLYLMRSNDNKLENVPSLGAMTPFAQAMPEGYRNTDPVVAYRSYYINVKNRIATWKKTRSAPAWYTT